MQEHQRIEKRIVRFADGRLSEQIEKTVAEEDRLLGRDFLNLNWREILGVESDFIIDSVGQRNCRAHLRLLIVLSRCRVMTTAMRRPALFPFRVFYSRSHPTLTTGHKKAAIFFGRGFRS